MKVSTDGQKVLLKGPRASRRVIALLVASGPDGLSRYELAAELWGNELPPTWQSALRNRLTTARKTLGGDSLVSTAGRLQLGRNVGVDSWDLLAGSTDNHDAGANDFWFLDDEPLKSIKPSKLVLSHRAQVEEVCIGLIDEAVQAERPLSAAALRSLRHYAHARPLERTVAFAAVRSHVVAGDFNQARAIVARAQTVARSSADQTTTWLDELAALSETPEPLRIVSNPDSEVRSRMFAAAIDANDWTLALEIAMAGLPEAERMDGDPERLKQLEAVPLDGLPPNLQFSLALSLARHLMYAGREEEACNWALITRGLAATPDEELLSYITDAIVGTVTDDRTPMPLPSAFDEASGDSINMRSLQVAVMNHLERASFDAVAPLLSRFTTLVQACAEPYRRWHLLLLTAMRQFVDGELEAAIAAAHIAREYADLFKIVDADIALVGQLSNQRLLHAGLPGVDDYQAYRGSSQSDLSRALEAVACVRAGDSTAVDRFLSTYAYESGAFFVFPTVTIVAPYVSDPAIRSVVKKRLEKRTETSAIWGTGVVHLGPVDRTLALLADDDDEARRHLASAVVVADRQRTRLWQVVCRLDLAACNNDETLWSEAETLATTASLKWLVANHELPEAVVSLRARIGIT